MSLILRKIIATGIEIGIWRMDDYALEERLNERLLAEAGVIELPTIKSSQRKKEIICTRLLLNTLLGEKSVLSYTPEGKPFLNDPDVHLSISHSYDYIAALINKNKSTGIDIQKINPKISRIKNKFLNAAELSSSSNGNNEIDLLHVLWGAKECIFKEYGSGKVFFAENILIEPFEFKTGGIINGSLHLNNQHRRYTLAYEKLDDYMLVYIQDFVNIVK